MSNRAPAFSITAIDCFERPVRYRLPFRFGAATLSEGVQIFVRARIRLADGLESEGATAELMVPKWFDKDPALTNADNVDQLRLSLSIATEAYTTEHAARSAFAHSAAHALACRDEGERRGLPALAAAFGAAEVDRAIVDALCRALGMSFFGAVRRNLLGFAPATLAADLRDLDADAFVASLSPSARIAVRHTVGLVDALDGHPAHANDGLPESLEEVIAIDRPRWFKIKLCGDPSTDEARLVDIARVLERVERYAITLDANEQFASVEALVDVLDRIAAQPRLRRLADAIAFIEQPLARGRTLESDMRAVAARFPLVIDEADATFDAFVRARALGYAGVSSKGCKGLYKSLANLARCRMWNASEGRERFLVSAEDLTTPTGLALQQDLALAVVLGVAHAERNGHHYIDGFAGQCAPDDEARAFAAAHPDLYAASGRGVRLAVHDGDVAIGSLDATGFASGALPRFDSLAAMRVPARVAG